MITNQFELIRKMSDTQIEALLRGKHLQYLIGGTGWIDYNDLMDPMKVTDIRIVESTTLEEPVKKTEITGAAPAARGKRNLWGG